MITTLDSCKCREHGEKYCLESYDLVHKIIRYTSTTYCNKESYGAKPFRRSRYWKEVTCDECKDNRNG